MVINLEDLVGQTTDVFWWLYKAAHRVIVSQGGTSSSKTYSQMQLLLFKASTEKNKTITVVGQDTPNMRVGVIRDTANIISNNPLLKKQVVKYNRSTLEYVFKSGSIIEFRSYEDSQDARSGKRDYAFFNEANGISEDIYNEVADRTSSQIYLDFNPSQRCWIHKRFENDPDALNLISNFTHNQFVSPLIIKSLLKYKESNPHRWRVFGLGLTGQSEGAIYTNWRHEPLTKFPKEYERKRFSYALDFGFTNDPTVLLQLCLHNNKLYIQELIYQAGLTDTALTKKFEELKISKNDEIIADSANPQSIATLRDIFGYNVIPADKPKDSIMAGIALLQDVQMVIVGESNNVVTELENYCYMKKDGVFHNKPIEKYNHAMDCARYYAIRLLGQPEIVPYVPIQPIFIDLDSI